MKIIIKISKKYSSLQLKASGPNQVTKIMMEFKQHVKDFYYHLPAQT